MAVSSPRLVLSLSKQGWASTGILGSYLWRLAPGITQVGVDECIRRNPRLLIINNEYARAVGAQPPGRCGVGIRRWPWVEGIAQTCAEPVDAGLGYYGHHSGLSSHEDLTGIANQSGLAGCRRVKYPVHCLPKVCIPRMDAALCKRVSKQAKQNASFAPSCNTRAAASCTLS